MKQQYPNFVLALENLQRAKPTESDGNDIKVIVWRMSINTMLGHYLRSEFDSFYEAVDQDKTYDPKPEVMEKLVEMGIVAIPLPPWVRVVLETPFGNEADSTEAFKSFVAEYFSSKNSKS